MSSETAKKYHQGKYLKTHSRIFMFIGESHLFFGLKKASFRFILDYTIVRMNRARCEVSHYEFHYNVSLYPSHCHLLRSRMHSKIFRLRCTFLYPYCANTASWILQTSSILGLGGKQTVASNGITLSSTLSPLSTTFSRIILTTLTLRNMDFPG